MSCGKIQNLLSAYIDRELTGQDQLQVRRHLDCCASCAEEHESLLTTKRMISGLSVRHPRADLEDLIIQALADEETLNGRKSRSPILGWWLTLPFDRRLRFAGALALGALALAAVRIAPSLLSPQQPPDLTQLVGNGPRPSPFRHEATPVNDVIFVANPARNAPASMSEFRGGEPR